MKLMILDNSSMWNNDALLHTYANKLKTIVLCGFISTAACRGLWKRLASSSQTMR